MVQGFPPELLQYLLSFLGEEDAIALRATCQAFHQAGVNATQLIMPFLNRLKAIDNQVCVLAPKDKNPTWCHERFISEFKRIAQAQEKEIQHFLKHKDLLPTLPKILRKIAQLQILNDSPDKYKIHLTALEQRHHLLEKLNAALIEGRIQINQPWLDINNIHLTRIPENLFTKAKYQNYWQSLENIYCSNNKLKTLPKFLGKCQALQEIQCEDNLLQTLPESLGDCEALAWVSCSNNQLKSLPESFNRCQALKTIYCWRNQLQALPDLSNCQELLEIACGANEIKELPESLGKCKKLNALYLDFNYIDKIPTVLINKFGDVWHQQTLKKQKTNNNKQSQKAPPSLPQTKFKLGLLTCCSLMMFIIVFTGYPLIVTLVPPTLVTLSLYATLAQSVIFGLGYLIINFYIRHKKQCQADIKAHHKTCDERWAELLTQFTTPTGQVFINSLNDMKNQAPLNLGLLLKFKKFRNNAAEKVAILKHEARNNAKKDAFKEAKKQFPWVKPVT